MNTNETTVGDETAIGGGQPPCRINPAWPPALRWAMEYLPHYFTDEPSQFHIELMGDIAECRRRLIARVGPRGHAKSTCAAFAYPLWCICERQRQNLVIITHELSLARQFVRDIRNELESNARSISTYGELSAVGEARSRKWTEELFTTTAGISLQAKSTGGTFRGARVGQSRPDLIICDDIEKDELVDSPEGRAKLENWLRRVVLPALAPEGRLLLLGSLIHHDSLLANVRDHKRFPCWDYKVYRAMEGQRAADGTYQMAALWPARWSVERLKQERTRIGTLAFEQEYLANPVDESVRVFRSEWLVPYDPAKLVEARLVTLIAVDPATGVSGGDFFALWVGSIDSATGIIYTRELTLERIGIVEQVKRIVHAFERWQPVRIGIEATAYQYALQQTLEERSRAAGLYMPIVPIKTLTNKRAKIEGTAPQYAQGMFRLPPGLTPEVESQFLQFPRGRHDDAPDVCAMGIELARSLKTMSGGPEVMTASRNPFAREGGW